MTDYLGFSQHPRIITSVSEAVDHWGVHATATPVVAGMTTLTTKVEAKLCQVLQQESATLFANGWSACFGVMAALVSKADFVVMDSLAHNSLATGAAFATQQITRFKHNDLADLEDKLKQIRANDTEHAIFIVLETWYSVNSDGPDLPRVMDLSHLYECIVIIDNSHDFGCMGELGLGVLEDIDLRNHDNLVIAGSLSKCFASNGGFVASGAVVKERARIYSQTYIFASAISPIQCAILLEALQITFSEEGSQLRSRLKRNYELARCEFLRLGFNLDGHPSAIIPVVIGEDKLARLMGRALRQRGVHANLAEFPVVARNRAIFRFIVSSVHSP
jgi:7-keto-8-aminopelargonate synthetase-like enzyme